MSEINITVKYELESHEYWKLTQEVKDLYQQTTLQYSGGMWVERFRFGGPGQDLLKTVYRLKSPSRKWEFLNPETSMWELTDNVCLMYYNDYQVRPYDPKNHKAEIIKSDPDKPKEFSGQFFIVDGKLSFTCHTQNIEFPEVLAGIIMLRDELNRQIDNQELCPFHPKVALKTFHTVCFTGSPVNREAMGNVEAESREDAIEKAFSEYQKFVSDDNPYAEKYRFIGNWDAWEIKEAKK